MNVRVVSGLNFDVKVVHKDFYEELKKIDIPQVTIKYEEIKFYYMDYEEICILDFHSEPQRCGYGTKAMLEILKIADKYKFVISLTPNTYEPYILTFWRKLGFSEEAADFENRIYLRYYTGYIKKENNKVADRKENKKNFLRKLKHFLNKLHTF